MINILCNLAMYIIYYVINIDYNYLNINDN